MEFGPRSLGARSILGDPRSPKMQQTLNLKVKYRESFRPFAPAVLREDVAEWFEFNADSPYMLIVAGVRQDKRRAMTPAEQDLFGIDKLNIVRSEIPAVTHVDYSARLQTVDAASNPIFHRLLFNSRTSQAALCWSIRASMCGESRSSARQRTRSAALWGMNSTCWSSGTAF
jgi:carbamoyltransferase